MSDLRTARADSIQIADCSRAPARNLYAEQLTTLGGATSSASTSVGSTTFKVTVLSPVPEPGTLVLVGSGLLGLRIKRKFRRHARNIGFRRL
jgi:hypothetical protein